MMKIDGKWVVVRSYKAGLSPCSIVLRINGSDFDQWINTIIPYIADSSLRARQHLLFTHQAASLWPQQFTLTLENGASILIDRTQSRNKSSVKGLYQAPDKVEVIFPQPDLLRITLPTFENPEIEEQALATLKRNLHVPVILFDVRGNNGGVTPLHLLKALIHHPFQNLFSTTPLSIAVNDAYAAENGFSFAFTNTKMQSGDDIIYPDHPLYNGQVYVLQDRVCASACEDFTRALQHSKSGIILGEASWGMDGAGHSNALPESHMSFVVGTERLTTPDGKPFDGIGVIPDIALPIIPTRLNSHSDTILEEALNAIGNNKSLSFSTIRESPPRLE